MPNIIKTWVGIAAVVLLHGAVSAGAATDPNSRGLNYSWVDKNGERHYGDAVPPEYSQTERRVLNNQGVEVQRVDAGKDAQQLAEQRKRDQVVQQKAQHDRFLLTTYTSTKDIERLRDERLNQLDGQIKAANAYVDTLEARLKALQDRALRFKPYNTKADARRMPDDLAEQLVHASNEMSTQRKSLDKRREEQTTFRTQFEADISRYRELTAAPPPG